MRVTVPAWPPLPTSVATVPVPRVLSLRGLLSLAVTCRCAGVITDRSNALMCNAGSVREHIVHAAADCGHDCAAVKDSSLMVCSLRESSSILPTLMGAPWPIRVMGPDQNAESPARSATFVSSRRPPLSNTRYGLICGRNEKQHDCGPGTNR